MIWTIQFRAAAGSAAPPTATRLTMSLRQSIIEGWKFSWQNEIVRTGFHRDVLARCSSSLS